MNAAPRSVFEMDPLLSLRYGGSALADLAFGSESLALDGVTGRPLAVLTPETLQLDLSDPAQRSFGDYELLELIGQGGMGVVYRARQISLDREVAVKLLASGPWASRKFVERFRREAQNAARMQHPNIVAIYEVGSAETLHFFSMRLVRGPSLATVIKQSGAMPAQRAAVLMRTVAEAVDYAHSLGVLHLDLKPGNVLLEHDGSPHVADFGLARRLEQILSVDNEEISGTPGYMAPEQAALRSGKIIPATDIWGLGAILYELLTGRPPFAADTPQATLKLVSEGELCSPRRHAPHLPRDLEAIVIKCMQHDPAARYSSARALADDLGRFIEGRVVRARPLGSAQHVWRWSRRQPYIAALGLLLASSLIVGIIGVASQWLRAQDNARRAYKNAAIASDRLWDARDESAQRLSETGDGWDAGELLLANLREQLAQANALRAQIARKRLGILENSNPLLIDVLPPADATALAFNADGSRLALAADTGELRMLDVHTGAELWRKPFPNGVLKYDFSVPNGLAFSPDGRRLIAMSAAEPLAVIHPARFQMSLFDAVTGAYISPPAAFQNLGDASYSSNGRFALLTDKALQSQFWQTDPWRPLSPKRKIRGRENAELRPAWIANDGKFFAMTASDRSVSLIDSRTLSPRRAPALGDFGHATAWAMSTDSHWLVVGDDAGHVFVIDCVHDTARKLDPSPTQGIRWLAFSDDGGWVAAAAGSDGVYLWDWPQGRLLAPAFGGRTPADHVLLDRVNARVLVSTFGATVGSASIWQISTTTFRSDLTEAVQLGDRFSILSEHTASVAWQNGGLLASARFGDSAHPLAQDALVRLERLQQPILLSEHAAPIKPSILRFNGTRIPIAEGNNVMLVEARTGRPIGAAIRLPQPAGFTELTANSASLVVSSGRELRVYDATTGTLRFAPIQLENSPQRVELAPDSRRMAATWLDHTADGVREVVETWSLVDGKRLGGPLSLRGPLHGIVFDSTSERVLLWSLCELTLRDTDTLAEEQDVAADVRMPCYHEYPAADQWLVSAMLDSSASVLAVSEDDTTNRVELRRYSTGRMTHQSLQDTDVALPTPSGKQILLVPDKGPLEFLDGDGRHRAFQEDSGAAAEQIAAISVDGRWIARALRNGVELFDARDRRRIARLLVPLPLPDRVWQLAFSPDGTRLLGRSLRNRYLIWNLTPDMRPADQIERELLLRGVAGQAPWSPSNTNVSERAALRARDPGPSTDFALPAQVPIRVIDGARIPPRDANAPSGTIDLTAEYNFGLREISRASRYSADDFAWLPQGVQRLLGVDYDLRGGIQLFDPEGLNDRSNKTWPTAVDVPLRGRTFAAIDTLMLLQYVVKEQQPVANIELVYHDGSNARLTIQFGRDAMNYWRQTFGKTARLAALGFDARGWVATDEGRPAHIYAVHLLNPRPHSKVDTLRLLAPQGVGSTPAFLAITLQPDRT